MFRTRAAASTLRAAATRLTRSVVASGIAGAAGLAIVAGGATPADAKPPVPKCADSSCIADATVTPGGLSISAVAHTTVATNAQLDVFKNGSWVVAATEYGFGYTHTLKTVDALAANTIYSWRLTAYDPLGNSTYRFGELSTLHRRVTVQFTSVTVTNDSDSGGAGDFTTVVNIPGQTMIPPLVPDSINSGETKPMGAVLVQRDAGTMTTIHGKMYDYDYFIPYADPFPWALTVNEWTNGTSDYGDWAAATGVLKTTAATPGLMPFAITVNSYVGFTMRGYYSVDFVS